MWYWAGTVFAKEKKRKEKKNHPPCLMYASLQLSWSVANLQIQCDTTLYGMEHYVISKHSLRPTAVHAHNLQCHLAVPTAALNMDMTVFSTFNVYMYIKYNNTEAYK
jgi:hypothetical protein